MVIRELRNQVELIHSRISTCEIRVVFKREVGIDEVVGAEGIEDVINELLIVEKELVEQHVQLVSLIRYLGEQIKGGHHCEQQ